MDLARDESYLLGKIAKEDYFNADRAIGQWQGEIVKIRKDRECTKEQAREAWNFLNELDSSLSPDLLQERIYESQELGAIYDEPWYALEINLEYSPRATVFARKIMPMFAEILKAEIEAKEA